MIVLTIIGCIVSGFLGKKQAAEGNNIIQQRKNWYNEIIAEKNK